MATAFFLLSKLVGLLLLVESWLFLGMLLGLIFLFTGFVVPAKWVLAGTFIILAVVISPLTDIVLARLETAYPANPQLDQGKPVDGILVLGGSIITSHSDYWGQPEFNHAGERITEAVRLSRQYPNLPDPALGRQCLAARFRFRQQRRE